VLPDLTGGDKFDRLLILISVYGGGSQWLAVSKPSNGTGAQAHVVFIALNEIPTAIPMFSRSGNTTEECPMYG